MMSAAALAGGVRRSWKLLGRMVVWQLQRSSTMPSGMQSIMSSNTTTTATSCLSGVTIENSFLNSVSSLSWAGVPGKTSSSIKLSNVRVAGSSSSAPWSGKEEKEEEQQGTNTGEEAERVDKAADNRDKSNYWGVTTKTHYREDGTKWPWKSFRPSDTYSPNYDIDLHKHREPNRWEEKLALRVVQLIKIPTVWFYRSRYGCRAMMLETVAAVPGMVGGMQLHLRSLRRFEQSGGWIKALLDEAENERMHLMTLMELVQPAWYERGLVVTTQGIFFGCYSLLYLMSPRLAHRVTGYLEEEAILSYTTYLDEIDKGNVDNVPAPAIAIDYWKLPKDARLREVILALRADEAHHRDVNHYAADVRVEGKQLHDAPAPIDYR